MLITINTTFTCNKKKTLKKFKMGPLSQTINISEPKMSILKSKISFHGCHYITEFQ